MRNYKGLDEFNLDYDNMKEANRLREFYRELFKTLRDEYSDELPEQDVRDLHWNPADPLFNKFKCQGNYFAGLKSDIFGLLSDRLIFDKELKARLICFSKYERQNDFTSKEEINLVNIILTDIISYLSIE